MNFNLLLGIAAVAYAIYTAVMRAKKPEAFGKLEAMRQQWGHGTGTAIHVIAYTVVPLIVGVVLIASALRSA